MMLQFAASETAIREFVKQLREATSKADGIENAVYDLKAVNPHRKPDVDRRKPTELLDLVEAKGVEIAKALSVEAELLIMDEPTSTLTEHEIVELFNTIRRLRSRGRS